MKATEIKYARLVNKGNFEHERIEITLTIEEGEKAKDVLEAARRFIASNTKSPIAEDQVAKARRIVENKTAYGYQQVLDAEQLLLDMEKDVNDDIPF